MDALKSSNAGFVLGDPVRIIGRTRRSLRDATTVHGRRVAYKSGLERDFLHLLSLDSSIEEVIGQPLTIDCPDPVAGVDMGSMQTCGVHYAAAAVVPSSFAGRKPG